MTDARVILASASPRRSELLAQVGVAHGVDAADVDESRRLDEPPEHYVARVARAKADAVAARHAPEVLIVAADTAVVIDGEPLGKPSDADDAARMLRRLAGRTHEVLTAVVVRRGLRTATRTVGTRVTFRPLSGAEIAAYCATDEPYDKAGAYAIQGRAGAFVSHLDGSFSGTVGLPLCETLALLATVGRADA